jgi:beta-galactosidase
MGANAWRMAHNPPNPELLDACDRLGMLVMNENRKLGDSAEIQAQVADMVLRDRNHPSIILWSMCNEEPKQGTPEAAKQFSTLRDIVLKHDPTRPVSAAMNGGMYDPISLAKVGDMVGGNYCDDEYDQLHKAHPTKPLYASETASTVTTRGEYANDKERTVVSSYNMTDRTWIPVADRAFVAGSFVWTGFDYKGEPTPYKWPCISSNFGVMDTCGFPKDNFFYYQAWWKSAPVVHVMPHWNWPERAGQEIKVIAFSNCEMVELLLNGQSLGTKPMRRNSHLEWSVKYAPGVLEAKGINKGELAASDRVETTGTPAALRLKTERLVLAADAEDLTVVEVDVVDGDGRIVPTAGNRVSFGIEGAGRIAGVGNGNPGDHDPDKAANRRAFNGKCMVLVGALDRPGPMVLTATADGLTPAVLKLKSIP